MSGVFLMHCSADIASIINNELVPKLEASFGEYEIAVVPRSMFAVDGSLLLCTDKARLMDAVEAAAHNLPATDTVSETPVPTNRVLIIDAMTWTKNSNLCCSC